MGVAASGGGVVDLSRVAGSAAAAWSKSVRVQLWVAKTVVALMGMVRGTSVGCVWLPRQSKCEKVTTKANNQGRNKGHNQSEP